MRDISKQLFFVLNLSPKETKSICNFLSQMRVGCISSQVSWLHFAVDNSLFYFFTLQSHVDGQRGGTIKDHIKSKNRNCYSV